MSRKKKKEQHEIEAFIIDAESFHESVQLLKSYRNSLQLAYDDMKETDDIPEDLLNDALEDLNEQIEVVNSLLNNFRASILKTIYGEGTKTPDYH